MICILTYQRRRKTLVRSASYVIRTVPLPGPTEPLRWSLNTVADVKCKFKSGSVSRYPSLFFFITIISASCKLFLLLIKYKLINGLLLLTRHSVERDPL